MDPTNNNPCANSTKCKCFLPCKCTGNKQAYPDRAFIVPQCIDKPATSTKNKDVEVPSLCTLDSNTHYKPSQSSVDDTEYNFPEFKEIICLPLHSDDINQITFAEILLIGFLEDHKLLSLNELLSLKNGKQISIGGFMTSIKRDGHNILLYNSSEFSCNGKSVEGSIYSLCDPSLNLIEEKRTDSYVDETGEKREKGLHLIMECDDSEESSPYITAFRTETENKQVSKYHSKIKLNVTGPFVPDGVNLILLRYLVIQNFEGTFETWSITINGDVCRSKYVFFPIKPIQINCNTTEGIQVVRYIMKQNNNTDIINMYFLLTGHLLMHEWNECPIFIYLNPLSPVPPTGLTINSFTSWKDNIELVSGYLDYKSMIESKLKTYLSDKPEVRCIIKDYIALLLQVKPVNILGLTIDYFLNLYKDKTMESSDDDNDDTEAGSSFFGYDDTEESEEEIDLEEPELNYEDELN